APGVPIMLCGNKLDLRINKKHFTATMEKNSWAEPVCFDQGVEMAKRIGAVAYGESSALMGLGVEELFHEVMRFGISFFRSQEQQQLAALRRRSGRARSIKNCGLM